MLGNEKHIAVKGELAGVKFAYANEKIFFNVKNENLFGLVQSIIMLAENVYYKVENTEITEKDIDELLVSVNAVKAVVETFYEKVEKLSNVACTVSAQRGELLNKLRQEGGGDVASV